MLRLSGAFYIIASVAFNSHVNLLEASPLPTKAVRREDMLMMICPDQSFARGGATDITGAAVTTMSSQKIKILKYVQLRDMIDEDYTNLISYLVFQFFVWGIIRDSRSMYHQPFRSN